HDEEVVHDLRPGGPDHLAQLGDHLAVERERRSALGARPRPFVIVAHGAPSSYLVDPPGGSTLQGTRDLNPQPSVLETDALPVAPVPSARFRAWRNRVSFAGFVKCTRRSPDCETGSHRSAPRDDSGQT